MTTDHGPRTTHPLRAVFMGTPEIAVPALRALSARARVLTVVTQPDRPAGCGWCQIGRAHV